MALGGACTVARRFVSMFLTTVQEIPLISESTLDGASNSYLGTISIAHLTLSRTDERNSMGNDVREEDVHMVGKAVWFGVLNGNGLRSGEET